MKKGELKTVIHSDYDITDDERKSDLKLIKRTIQVGPLPSKDSKPVKTVSQNKPGEQVETDRQLGLKTR